MYKEARPLFWPWCAVMCAGAVPLLHPPYPLAEISGLGFLLGMPLLAALPFGNEFQNRTFPLLLSQPISRMEIWRQKLSITAIVVFTADLISLSCLRGSGVQTNWGFCAVAAIVFVASAPFWTLLTRSIVGGAVLNFGGYFFMFFLVGMVFSWERGYSKVAFSTFITTMNCVFLGYAVLMLWLGWRKLARFQVTGGMGGDNLLMAGPGVMPEAVAGWLRCRPTGAVLNLIRKEFRLLQPVWLISLLAAVGWACLTGSRMLHQHGLSRDFQSAVVSVAAISTLMIAILAGSLSLGEERTSGTHLWHLTLPVPVFLQWGVKLGMALFAGFVGAWLLPVSIAGRALFVPSRFWDGRHFEFSFLIAVLLLTFAAFWCACAVNGTVRAVLWVVPVMVVLYYAGELGKRAGPAFTHLFFPRFDPFANVKLANAVSHLGSNGFFKLIQAASDNMTDSVQAGLVLTTIILVPTLLYAVIQSYRLFRAQPQDRAWSVVRSLVPLALIAFLCNFALLAFEISVGRASRPPKLTALFETVRAIEKAQSGAAKLDATHPLQLTVEDLAKAYPLSKSTRRLLGNSHITLRLENAQPSELHVLGYPWCSANIPLADGSRFTVAFEPGNHYLISAGISK
jgi:hypothetical protein